MALFAKGYFGICGLVTKLIVSMVVFIAERVVCNRKQEEDYKIKVSVLFFPLFPNSRTIWVVTQKIKHPLAFKKLIFRMSG